MAHVALGRVLERRGDHEAAEAEIGRAVELSSRGIAKAEIGYALLAHAQISQALGKRETARMQLQIARRAIDSCPDPGVLNEILARTERRLRTGASLRDPTREELTDREQAVLRLLPSALSLREIGSTLYVSLNTVKTHAKSIYRKLGVSGRDEAVKRARELGLL